MLHGIFSDVINAVVGAFAGFLLLRFWIQALRIRPPTQLASPIFKLTDWIVLPLRRVVKGMGGFDWASLIATFLASLVLVMLDVWMFDSVPASVVVLLVVWHVLQWIIYGLIIFLILEVILSWVNPHAPLAPFFRSLNEPILAPLRKIIPPIGGMDFSPMVALLILQILLTKILPFLFSLF